MRGNEYNGSEFVLGPVFLSKVRVEGLTVRRLFARVFFDCHNLRLVGLGWVETVDASTEGLICLIAGHGGDWRYLPQEGALRADGPRIGGADCRYMKPVTPTFLDCKRR